MPFGKYYGKIPTGALLKRSFISTACSCIYLIMGLVYGAAVFAGLDDWLGWPWWLALIISIPISYTPFLGTIVATVGAITSFDWSPMFTVALLYWPYLLFGALARSEGIAACIDAISKPFFFLHNQLSPNNAKAPCTQRMSITNRPEVTHLTHEPATASQTQAEECATIRTRAETPQQAEDYLNHTKCHDKTHLEQPANRVFKNLGRLNRTTNIAYIIVLRPLIIILKSSACLVVKVITGGVKWLNTTLVDPYERMLVASLLLFLLVITVILLGLLVPRAALITVTCLLIAASALHSILSDTDTPTEPKAPHTKARDSSQQHKESK